MRMTEREFKLLKGGSDATKKRETENQKAGCEIQVACDDGGEIAIVQLTFTGQAAHFPSTSNTKTILTRKWGQGIGNTKEAQERLSMITDCFAFKLMQERISPPTFLDEPVQILIALADRRSDSHNYSKPICDWIQYVGIINNDKQAEAHCIRKRDYSAQYGDYDRTTLLIMRREFAHSFYEKILGSLLWQTRQLLGEA